MCSGYLLGSGPAAEKGVEVDEDPDFEDFAFFAACNKGGFREISARNGLEAGLSPSGSSSEGVEAPARQGLADSARVCGVWRSSSPLTFGRLEEAREEEEREEALRREEEKREEAIREAPRLPFWGPS